MSAQGQNSTLVSSTVAEPYIGAPADGSSEQNALWVNAKPMLLNGSTLDRQRGNTEGTLLASAARTASVESAAQTNYNARGVRITVYVTAKAAATNLALYLSETKAWGYAYIMAIPVWTAGAGKALICDIYPGVTPAAMAAGIGVDKYNAVSLPLGRTWVLEVFPSDANSVTYSVDYAYIL